MLQKDVLLYDHYKIRTKENISKNEENSISDYCPKIEMNTKIKKFMIFVKGTLFSKQRTNSTTNIPKTKIMKLLIFVTVQSI